MFLSIGMLKQKYFLTDIFILSAEKQPIKLSWRKIEWLQQLKPTQFILHSPYFLIQSIVLPILRLLVYVRCYKIDNRNDRIKETRQEYPKQSLYPTV